MRAAGDSGGRGGDRLRHRYTAAAHHHEHEGEEATTAGGRPSVTPRLKREGSGFLWWAVRMLARFLASVLIVLVGMSLFHAYAAWHEGHVFLPPGASLCSLLNTR